MQRQPDHRLFEIGLLHPVSDMGGNVEMVAWAKRLGVGIPGEADHRASTQDQHPFVVCPITHSPPSNLQSAVKISSELAAHLGLDGDRMWIKTDAVNEFTWEKDMIPIGVSPVNPGSWSYGMLPDKISEEVIKQARNHSQAQVLEYVRHDESGSS